MKYLLIILLLTGCVSYGSYQQHYDRAQINLSRSLPNALIWEDENNHMYFFMYDTVTNIAYIANLGQNKIGIQNIQILYPIDVDSIKTAIIKPNNK